MTALTPPPALTTTSGQPACDKTRPTNNRVQFDLPPRSMQRLNTLKRKTEAISHAKVVKSALRLYEALIEETESGKQFLIRDAAGTISPYRLFL